MKILFIGGNQIRHLYVANAINSEITLSGAILQQRGSLIPKTPDGLEDIDRKNFIRHFKEREECELRYFQKQKTLPCPTITIDDISKNSGKLLNFYEKIKPDVVFIFGSGMIGNPLFSKLPRKTINMHLGLSPRYRGSATLFWPFYFLEPTYAGSTFHFINQEPDAGDVIHQVRPFLEKGDGIHDVACKVVLKSAEEAIKLLKKMEGKDIKGVRQKNTGKKFLTTDFRPEHLRVIYNLFENKIVDYYLEGKLRCRTPKLVETIFA
ncbi:MAG: formyltransferase family protein [Candidatus Curtissbacteria bacterium]|nr:formyltransferase family protein [Candidatus Curtissbacteria bacterium]